MRLRPALGALLLIMLASRAAADPLIVNVEGISPSAGALTVSVFAGAGTFLRQPAATATVAADGAAKQSVRIDLPPGRYAVSVIHDVNGNGVLDTNLLGIPSEPV